MNEQLRFSWGHIIAFLVLIFIAYVTFMGATYLSDGNFELSFLATIIVIILILILFIGAQVLKSTTEKFHKRIKLERILIFSSPVLFIILMIPYFHFWTVYQNQNQIESQFKVSIESSKNIFNQYKIYSSNRVNAYGNILNDIIKNKTTLKDNYQKSKFEGRNDDIQKNNKKEALELLLKSNEPIETEAVEWINNAQEATVWNIFILGNIQGIKDAISSWRDRLVGFSSVRMEEERLERYNGDVKLFDEDRAIVNTIENSFNNLNELYTEFKFPSLLAIITAVLCFFLLYFPYLLQERHTKSKGINKLFNSKKKVNSILNPESKTYDDDDENISISIQSEKRLSRSESQNEDDFTFTL